MCRKLAPSQGSLKNSGCRKFVIYNCLYGKLYNLFKTTETEKHVYVNTYYKIFTFKFHSNYIALKLYSFSANNFEYCVVIVSLLQNEYISTSAECSMYQGQFFGQLHVADYQAQLVIIELRNESVATHVTIVSRRARANQIALFVGFDLKCVNQQAYHPIPILVPCALLYLCFAVV